MIYTHSFDYTITSDHTEISVQTGRLDTRVPGGASSIPREQHTRLPWQPTSRHIYSGPKATLTPTIKRETIYTKECHTCNIHGQCHLKLMNIFC